MAGVALGQNHDFKNWVLLVKARVGLTCTGPNCNAFTVKRGIQKRESLLQQKKCGVILSHSPAKRRRPTATSRSLSSCRHHSPHSTTHLALSPFFLSLDFSYTTTWFADFDYVKKKGSVFLFRNAGVGVVVGNWGKSGFSHGGEGDSLLENMADIQLGCHTIKSHGVKLARFHLHDWLVFLVLVVIDIVLNVIEPFHRFVGRDNPDIRYPLKSNTVPFWAVPLTGVVLPLIIITGIYFKRRDVYDLHHAILGLLYSVLLTGVITDAIKDAVGRPRPDFFWRCFPDGKEAYDNVGNVICTGLTKVIKEGHKSFPSRHSSWSFAGLGFTSWYLAGKIKAFDREGHIAKLCIVFAPLLLASLVAISRVDDYWDHWQDVFGGGLLGLAISSFCYLQFFPMPYRSEGWGPHAYFRMLADSRTNVTPAVSVDSRRPEIETAYDASII